MSWLLGTLAWTGALIGGALLLRRPVARYFGAKAAYSLWFLPLLRLALPPIVLPAWLAPVRAGSVAPAGGDFVQVIEPGTASQVTEPAAWIDWFAVAVTVWLAGALIYMAARLISYFRLRRDLLEDARIVGTAGRVRLCETPATASPLAFGVIDKVIALPPGFMALTDRRARDLALAHELAHHHARDLAVNFVALPLFALHWFNPLSLLGWRAMRRDQEAACDLRVVERCNRLDRATYAALIASTVAGPRGALAAPMACPVLGDKSIVHRLRNLTMTTQSARRRRLGAALLGASVLLVPFTASISYAQDDASDVPASPGAPSAPATPLTAVEPRAPLAPAAPLPPTPGGNVYVIESADPNVAPHDRRVVIVRDRKRHKDDQTNELDLGHNYRVFRFEKDGKFDEKGFEKRMRALDERLGRLDFERRVMPPEEIARITADAQRSVRIAMVDRDRAPTVLMTCDGQGDVSESTSADGKRVIRICQRRILASTTGGLRAARAEVARTAEMSADVRAQVLEDLDREIARLEQSDRSE